MEEIWQSRKYQLFLQKRGWIVKRHKKTNYFIKKFLFFGSLIKVQRPQRIDLDFLDELTKKYKAFFVVIEPKKIDQEKKLLERGFKKSKSVLLPTKTLIIDLKKPLSTIFKKMKKDARKAIQKNEKIKILKNTPQSFYKAWKKAVSFKRYVPSIKSLQVLKKTFKEDVVFLTTKDKSSGAVFVKNQNKAYYWFAFTNKKGRKKLYQYRIVWEGIKWAKKSGCSHFDFLGIFDERVPKKDWLGFSHFKKSFGGEEKEYPLPLSKGIFSFLS